MDLALNPVSISTRRKLASILLSVAIFATLAGLASRANGRPGIFAILDAIFVGTAVGFFEEFYVQRSSLAWCHPSGSGSMAARSSVRHMAADQLVMILGA